MTTPRQFADGLNALHTMGRARSLTKSLHTVTAVTKVALYIRANDRTLIKALRDSASQLTDMALTTLGYADLMATSVAGPHFDPTYAACVKAVTKALAKDLQS